MPIYTYKHPEKEEYIEIFQSMNEEHSYKCEKGLQWKRVFTSPQISANVITDPWDKNTFVNETKNMKGTIGDMMDKSAELSNMRAEKNGGVDPVKQKYFDNYKKERGGVKDPLDPSNKKVFENKHIKATLD
jgi:hypothetical protein|tara:strand:- start:663 stop:1055 length:393 start_codon:yes stop_codon:yes gene_type:complete